MYHVLLIIIDLFGLLSPFLVTNNHVSAGPIFRLYDDGRIETHKAGEVLIYLIVASMLSSVFGGHMFGTIVRLILVSRISREIHMLQVSGSYSYYVYIASLAMDGIVYAMRMVEMAMK